MKISVIMPSFNQDRYLLAAMGSALEYDEVELIVIDPGSTDSSRPIIQALAALYPERIKMVFEKDSGPAEALNKGITLATGEIIGVLNSDDYYLPGGLDHIQRIFKAEPNIDALFASGIISFQDTGQFKYHAQKTPTKWKLATGVSNFYHQGIFYKAKQFPNLRFNENNKVCWDSEFVASMLQRHGNFQSSNTPVAVFRIHASSITGSQKFAELYSEEKRRINRDVLSIHKLGNIDRILKIVYRLYNFLGSLLYQIKMQFQRL